jgi:hypothetical protein
MFNRKEVFSYFQDRYTENQVIQALRILSDSQLDLNPDAEFFQDSTVDDLEHIFLALGSALEEQKKVSAASSTDGQIEILNAVAALASTQLIQQDIRISDNHLMAIAKVMISDVLNQVEILSQISEKVFLDSLQSKQDQLAKKIAETIFESSKKTRQIFDAEAIKKIVSASALKNQAFDVENFLTKVKNHDQDQSQKSLPQIPQKKDLDIDLFLKEHWGDR